MKLTIRYAVSLFATIMTLSSCYLDESNIADSTGGFDEVLVVADDTKWEKHFHEKIYRHFEKPYDVLPQPEKSLVVTHVPFHKFDNIFKRYRNILVIADLEDDSDVTQLTLKYLGEEQVLKAFNDPNFFLGKKNNLWANDQLVVFLFAPGIARLDSILTHKGDILRELFLQNELHRYHAAAMAVKENKVIMNMIREKFAIDMDIPSDYFVAIDEANYMWIRKETEEVSFNLMLYQEAADNHEASSRGIDLRNMLGKKYISSAIEGSYMTTDSTLTPEIRIIKRGRLTIYETRGLWRLEHDFMGGPFVTHYFIDTVRKKAYLIDAFVHAPGTRKKPQLRRLEALMATIRPSRIGK